MALVPHISYVVKEIKLQVYQTIFSLRTKFLLRDQALLAKSGQSAQSLLKPTGSPSPWPPIPRSTLERRLSTKVRKLEPDHSGFVADSSVVMMVQTSRAIVGPYVALLGARPIVFVKDMW